MTEGKKEKFELYHFLSWSMSYPISLKRRGLWALLESTTRSNQDGLSSLLWDSHVVHVVLYSVNGMMGNSWACFKCFHEANSELLWMCNAGTLPGIKNVPYKYSRRTLHISSDASSTSVSWILFLHLFSPLSVSQHCTSYHMSSWLILLRSFIYSHWQASFWCKWIQGYAQHPPSLLLLTEPVHWSLHRPLIRKWQFQTVTWLSLSFANKTL